MAFIRVAFDPRFRTFGRDRQLAIQAAIVRAGRRTLAVARRIYQREARRAAPRDTGRMRRALRTRARRFGSGGVVYLNARIPYFHAYLAVGHDFVAGARERTLASPELTEAFHRFFNEALDSELKRRRL